MVLEHGALCIDIAFIDSMLLALGSLLPAASEASYN